MRSIFADYLSDSTPDKPPDATIFERLLESLRKVLIFEMRRRGLWQAPPRYLGIYGGERWGEGDTLEELLLDCYEYVFVRRIAGLRQQAAACSNLDGLIFLNVRHFLHDTQRQHDPLGYRVFEVAHAAVEGLVAKGRLHVVAGDRKIRNETVLGFEPWADPAMLEDLDPQRIARWNDELMPDLVTAWRRENVVERLTLRIAALSEEGCNVFSFRQLVEPLKDDARARWMAMLFEAAELDGSGADGELKPTLTLSLPTRHGFEEREAHRALLACIRRSIATSAGNARAKEYLSRLFDFLHRWSAAHEEGPPADPAPSDRRLAEALDIPRGRVQELKETLGRLASGCRERSSALPSAAPRSRVAVATTAEGLAMSLQERREQLRRGTRSVAPAESDTEPTLGDAFVFPQLEVGVEWLLIGDEPSGEAHLVAIDSVPLVGSRDLELDPLSVDPLSVDPLPVDPLSTELLVARCGVSLHLDPAVLASARRSRRLGAETSTRVRERLTAITAAEIDATSLEREVDDDSEYRGWLDSLEQARRQLQGETRREASAGSVLQMSVRKRRAARSTAPIWALAATLALGMIGLSFYTASLQRELRSTDRPLLVPSGGLEEIRLGSAERGLDVRLMTADGRRAIVYLVFRDVPDFPAYRLRWLDAGGGLLWQSDPLSPTELLLMLPLDPAGTRLQLLGEPEAGNPELLDERRLVREEPVRGVP